jgi:hypothetical protein
MNKKTLILFILFIVLQKSNTQNSTNDNIWGWWRFNQSLNNEKTNPPLTTMGGFSYVPGRYGGYALKFDSSAQTMTVKLDSSFSTGVYSISLHMILSPTINGGCVPFGFCGIASTYFFT